MDLTENFYRAFRSDNGRGRLRSVAGHDCADSTRRIAEYCGITGYTATVSTACSSAANAVITGALLLENDMADYVVAGGTDALCRFTLNGFNSLSILDRERCRPFDATRAGLNLGEGAGYVVLAREAPGMRSYCRLARGMPTPTTPTTRPLRPRRARGRTAPWPKRWPEAGWSAWTTSTHTARRRRTTT